MALDDRTIAVAQNRETILRRMITMRLKVDICCDNVAFDGDFLRAEIVECLDRLRIQLSRGDDRGQLIDSNGNVVGTWSLADAEK